MYVHQIDFFAETSQIFSSNIMRIAREADFAAGESIFHEGDPAANLYILRKGRVRLGIGRSGRVVYIVSRSGEAFGWSSLIGRESYSASAETLAPTSLMIFDRDKFLEVVQNDPRNGVRLYRGLAVTLANRLLQSYQVIAEAPYSAANPSQGSRQLQPAEELE